MLIEWENGLSAIIVPEQLIKGMWESLSTEELQAISKENDRQIRLSKQREAEKAEKASMVKHVMQQQVIIHQQKKEMKRIGRRRKEEK